MKTIAIFLILLGLNVSLSAQGIAEQMTNLTNTSECELQYSEDSEALEFSGASVKCREITISSLPPVTQVSAPINIEFGMTGTFTFKKGINLSEYETKDVYIEDMLTGRIFNLKNMDKYSFNVNRRVPNRFVLHIDNMLSKYALSSSFK